MPPCLSINDNLSCPPLPSPPRGEGRRRLPPPRFKETRRSEPSKKPESTNDPNIGQQDLESVRRLRDAFKDIKQQLSRVIVGQDQVIEELLIALFSRGHCILEGVPGLAKTLM